MFALTFAGLVDNEQVFVGFLDLDSLSKLGLVHNNAKTRKKIRNYSSFEAVEARTADYWIIKNKESKQTRVFNSETKKFLAEIQDEEKFQEFMEGFSLYDYDFILDENRKFVAAKERKRGSLKYYFCDDLEAKIWPKLFGNGFSLSYDHFLKDIDWGKSEFAITIKRSFSSFKIFAHPPQRRTFVLQDRDLENASIQVRKMYIKYNSIAEYKKFCRSKVGSNEEHGDPEMFAFLQKHGMDPKEDYVQGKNSMVWAKIPPGHENQMRYHIQNYDARTKEIYYYLKENKGIFGAIYVRYLKDLI
jgi:hypothetical protein